MLAGLEILPLLFTNVKYNMTRRVKWHRYMPLSLDEIDVSILRSLLEDGRKSFRQISRETGIINYRPLQM